MLPYFESAHQNPKNITFTCIRARSSVCYAGKECNFQKKNINFTSMTGIRGSPKVPVMQVKVMIGNKKPHFYLHNSHLVWLLCR